MNNCEHFGFSPLRLPIDHVKEAMRCVLHTVVFNRSIGSHTARPMNPLPTTSAMFGLTYMRTDDPQVDQEIELKVKQLGELLERRPRQGSAVKVQLSFYITKNRKASMLNWITGTEDKVTFEQWTFPVTVYFRSGHPLVEQDEEAEKQAQAEMHSNMKRLLMNIVLKINMKMDHLPPTPEQSSYRFEVSFIPDGPNGAWSPRTMMPAMRNIQYIT
mmetsp:Transcript_6217/g.15360  ORF Transcript_6217/g.15360 Transcript_6217/m.15360 type:complete len:215 (-) Transcript_6217:69-713(-)